MKPAEEGELWEWRGFGRVSEALAAEVRSHPIRMGIKDLEGEDLYFVSPVNDQNVKLRRSNRDWFLKLKPLFARTSNSIERYGESASLEFDFPVGPERVREAAGLLEVSVSRDLAPNTGLIADDFIEALTLASPAVITVRVLKKRSQFEFDGGWVELAEVTFPRCHTESISIHSYDSSVVERILDRLQPGGDMEAMNYVQACRRWR